LTAWQRGHTLKHRFEQGTHHARRRLACGATRAAADAYELIRAGRERADEHHDLGAIMTDIVSVVDEGLGNSSYLVDLGDGRALVIDPARHPSAYLRAARSRRLQIAYAAETHLHADFVSGVCELRALGAQVVVPAAGGHAFATTRLGNGDELDLGGLTLRALATPGHTPEHVAYLLADGERPIALFSGGSLLVGAVARTDLISPDRTEELARALWRSLHDRLLGLPDDLAVYPTHGAGSFCSAPAGGNRTTTIGREKVTNPLLAAGDEDEFVRRLLDGLGTYPPYFLRLRDVNRAGPLLHGPAEPLLPLLDPDTVEQLAGGGAWIVDARSVAAYAAGHLPGSVANTLRAQFGTWLGWLAPADAAFVFVLEAGQDRADLVRQTRNVGFEQILGELRGGIEAWATSGRRLATVGLVPMSLVDGRVIDVRQAVEYAAGHLPRAMNAELGAVTSVDLPPGDLTLMCGHGERAMTAASLLARQGRTEVAVAIGGPDDWAAATGNPLGGPP
jgi:glyoxylase-like metal-dependent hydrolase (beta-lactamase superfamily II)